MSQYNRAKSSNTLTLENLNKNKNVISKVKGYIKPNKQDQINETIFELMSLKEGLKKIKKERRRKYDYENNEKIVKLYDT